LEVAHNKASNSEQFFRRFFVAGATLPQKIHSKIAAFWRRYAFSLWNTKHEG
jgi:hypothetical protein